MENNTTGKEGLTNNNEWKEKFKEWVLKLNMTGTIIKQRQIIEYLESNVVLPMQKRIEDLSNEIKKLKNE